jgi:uncharacterized protein YqgC (DUF456 family)
MSWIPPLVAVLLLLLGGACVLAVVVQLPGAWIFLALALAVELADGLYLPPGERTTFALPVWITGLGLAALGEVLEFLAAAVGLRRGGGSRRGLVGALLGAIAGVFLTPLFAFVPVLGLLLGVLLGTFVGALLGELSHERRSVRVALRPALWAALGRLLGTTGKVALTIALWLVFTVSAFWS